MKKILLITLALLVVAPSVGHAVWVDNTTAPPGNNALAPIHTGVAQNKSGSLTLTSGSLFTQGLRSYLDSYFDGKVGIGNTSPDATSKLDVTGKTKTSALQITSGFPAPGKILTSLDASGNATWSTATVGTTYTATSPVTITGSVISLGNVPVTKLNSGTGASATTFWRGDGTWATPASGGGGITALTGDVTANGSGSVPATLATVNTNVGSFTNANITVNGKGLITAVSSGTVLPNQTGNSGKFLTTNGTSASWGTVTSGVTGPQGPAGPTGPQGPAGPTLTGMTRVLWRDQDSSWCPVNTTITGSEYCQNAGLICVGVTDPSGNSGFSSCATNRRCGGSATADWGPGRIGSSLSLYSGQKYPVCVYP